MKNVKATLVLSFLAFAFCTNAQISVYRTFEDFQNGKTEHYDEYSAYYHVLGRVALVFETNKKKTKIHCRDMWGFKYKDALFRIDHVNNQPTKVMSVGKITYYESGIAHLDIMQENKEKGEFSVGYACYLSKNLNTKMVPLPSEWLTDARKKIKKFKLENPEFQDLFDCIGKNYDYLNVRPCIEAFEKDK